MAKLVAVNDLINTELRTFVADAANIRDAMLAAGWFTGGNADALDALDRLQAALIADDPTEQWENYLMIQVAPVTEYRSEIQATADGGRVWQTIEAVRVPAVYLPDDLAKMVAEEQNITEACDWRVCIFIGDDNNHVAEVYGY
jgi:hypothetical protein